MEIVKEGLRGGVSGAVSESLQASLLYVRDMLIPEFKSLWGTDEEVKRLKDQKDRIWEFLWDVSEKQIVDKRQMHFVIRRLHLAYNIETALETFHDEYPHPQRGPDEPPLGIPGYIKGGLKKIRFLSNFQKEIADIKEEIRKLEEYRKENEITTVGEDWDDVGGQNKRIKRDPVHTLRPIGDPDIVGFATDINNILRWLLDKNIVNLAVVSVVGIGGAGKSTITRKVCNSNDVKESFDKVIFIEITRNYVLRNILREIAKMLEINSNDKDERELSYLIWERLENTRYLIVLDDVWTEDLWDELSKILPDKEKGSRVMITTRFENVAKRAHTKYTYLPRYLPLLDADESLNLFLKKAVPKNHQCPDPSSDLYNIAEQFAAKCQGLPLALELLGGLVSIKPYTFHGWKKLLETMSWHVDVRKCIDAVATSYECLPLIEKLCFMYLAAFPPSTKIDAKELLRIWSGEGLIRIRPNDKRTVEEIAECILEDLAQRNMVRVLKRFPDGSIEDIQLHDVLTELAVKKAQELNFLMVCSKPDVWEHCSNAPRVAIHYSSDLDVSFGIYASHNVYSLFISSDLWSWEALNLDCSKVRRLRVLRCDGRNWRVVKLWSLELRAFSHLRYLRSSDNLKWKGSGFEEWIRGMKYLETLDLRKLSHGFTDCMWQAKTQLRHVLLPDIIRTGGPPVSVDLKNLLTLNNVEWNSQWGISSFPNIPNVRDLDIYIPPGVPGKEVVSLIRRLKYVVHLKITGCLINFQEIASAYARCCIFSETLKSLKVTKYGRYGESYGTEDEAPPFPFLRDGMLPPYLIELYINGYVFESDFMPVLEKLGSLKVVALNGMYKAGNLVSRIKCSAGGFKQLEALSLNNLDLEEWEIEPGAMPMLKTLQVWYCDPLRVPPELTNQLSSLQSLEWVTQIQTNKDALRNISEQQPNLVLIDP
ncbi:Disease resistance protein (CC-NBS-LRR class) family protein [Rhynchospora pubera]|uniref:Disease resistance protein (CC-NBS-LRR class) family protein n=1 Tax=Rhynchospora pubera TaxID=906938 RepID=A0AAV8CJD2_9POAL|nr:Disease resistance protein (CC-NBS-LRR class) family protein [Rhynchospora pubera]